MNMNKLFLLVGLLSAGVAVGQTNTKTTKASSTTSTSNYNNSNTNNYNSQNATSGTNSSTNGTSTTGSTNNGTTTGGMSSTGNRGSMGSTTQSGSSGSMNSSTQSGSNGSMNSTGTTGSSMGTGTTGSSMGTGTSGSSVGSDNNSTSGSTNGTGSGSTSSMDSTTQPTGSGSSGSMGTTGNTTNGTYNNSTSVTPSGTNNTTTGGNGAMTTTPSTSGNYNSRNSTTNSTYSTATTTTANPRGVRDYKNFSYGIYAGANTTRFKGESFDANGAASGLTGRLGYQLGFFVRGGGRLYGQIGAEYFASSSNYFTTAPGSGTTTATSIRDRIDVKYIQVPVYIGYKLTESDRGISAVRVQVGLEYANQIGSSANQFGNLKNFQVKGGTFNGLAQLGFDAGPVFLDLTYHHGFSNAIEQNTGFAGSQRRILSASLGFKF